MKDKEKDKDAGSKKKRQQEGKNAANDGGKHRILSDHEVTSLIWSEVSRMREDLDGIIHGFMMEVLRQENHPLTLRLREMVREELSRPPASNWH